MTGIAIPRGTPTRIVALIEAAAAADRRADRAQARQSYRDALQALGSDSDPRLESSLLRWIGRSFLDDGDVDAASEHFERALEAAEAHGELAAMAHAVNCKALIHYVRGRLDDAEKLYQWAARHAQLAGERKLIAMIQQNLGIIANIRGDWDAALEHYQRSSAMYEALGLTEYLGPLLNNVARLQTDLGLWADADESLAQAHASCESAGQVAYQVLVEVSRARLRIAERRFGPARASCDRALELTRSTGDDRWLGDIYRYYGSICRAEGNRHLAVEHYRRADEIATEKEDLLLAAEIAAELAEVFWSLRRNQETLQQLSRAHRLFADLKARHALADVSRRIAALEARFLKIVREWGESIESADHYTQGHCQRVADYACELALADGFDPAMLTWFRMGALLHDVGKVAVPKDILNKEGPLDDDEWAMMKSHSEIGAQLLHDTDFPWDVRPMVRHHHERWDGAGYPDGLAGSEIPRAAQILAVADVFDALTSDRSYRARLSVDAALQILWNDAGTAFNPELVALFIRLRREEEDSDHRGLQRPGSREAREEGRRLAS